MVHRIRNRILRVLSVDFDRNQYASVLKGHDRMYERVNLLSFPGADHENRMEDGDSSRRLACDLLGTDPGWTEA